MFPKKKRSTLFECYNCSEETPCQISKKYCESPNEILGHPVGASGHGQIQFQVIYFQWPRSWKTILFGSIV